ncbi:MAG TPA: metalloregulator ArsR/SmtB family transcription factor [Dehalococcoidia bacterium]|nr:metalloregulator ArsR/SmtB family transcription factor [Dehalococcoidia bacterium]
MSHRAFKNKLYAEFARVGTALGSDKRLELLDLLAQGPRYVDALAAELEMSVANVSQHLQVLRNAKLVESEREGTRVLYRLTDESVLKLWLDLRGVAEGHLPEIAQLRRQYAVEGLDEELPRGELEKLMASGDVVLIDVRPKLEFEHGHLAGALAIPVEELAQRLADLPRDKRIVAYCRGTYCLFADEAVALLKQDGFDAVRLEGGWPEWLAENRDVE